MAEWKQIPISEITQYKDPFALFEEWAAGTAKGKQKTNSIILGWGGLGILWGKPCCTVYIHETRYSRIVFDETETFSVEFFSREKYQKELDYLGSATGYKEDKILGCGLTINENDIAPFFEEGELVILCKKMAQSKFDLEKITYPERTKNWYQKDGVHTIYYGEIIKVLKRCG